MLQPAPTRTALGGQRRRGLLLLVAWSGAVAIVWLAVLPWWSDRPAMQAHLDWLRDRRIDPSAMYYTELEAMRPILQDLNRGRRER